MKIEKVKHDHKLTDLLKVGIFALILLAPLMAVAVKCAYVICNKNAYQSYSGQAQTEYTNTFDFQVGETYLLQGKTNTKTNYLGESANCIYASECTYNETTYANVRLGFYREANTTNTYLYCRDTSTNTQYFDFTVNANKQLTFVYQSSTGINENTVENYFYEITTTNFDKLDNVFTYAVKDLANNDLFNWTQNTAIYTGINAMCTNLEIGTPVIAILITYWTLIVIIYVIIDILLKGFVYLTHLIMRGN